MICSFFGQSSVRRRDAGVKKRPKELVDAIIKEARRKNPYDVLGSYTGVPWDDDWDVPVQDADDL